MKKIIKGLPGQTPMDIILKHYGDMEGIVQFMLDNPDQMDTDTIEDVDIKIDTYKIINQPIQNYFSNRQIVTY